VQGGRLLGKKEWIVPVHLQGATVAHKDDYFMKTIGERKTRLIDNYLELYIFTPNEGEVIIFLFLDVRPVPKRAGSPLVTEVGRPMRDVIPTLHSHFDFSSVSGSEAGVDKRLCRMPPQNLHNPWQANRPLPILRPIE
jgi:hypothetical protein